MNAYLVSGKYFHDNYVAGYWCGVTEQVDEVVYADTAEYASARFERRYWPGLEDHPRVTLLTEAVSRKRRGFASKGDPLWEKAFAILENKE